MVTREPKVTTKDQPDDKYKVVYTTFFWLGIVSLLPWNMFICVSEYWNYKFRTLSEKIDEEVNIHPFQVETFQKSNEEDQDSNSETDLQVKWGGYLAVASMLPNVTFLILNGLFGHKFPTRPKVIISLTLLMLGFIFTSIMVKTNTEEWQVVFFNITLVSAAFISINAANLQGGVLGVAARFPPKYTGAVFSGQAVGGILASGTNVLVLAAGLSPVFAAFFCFSISVVFMGLSLISFIIATYTKFYKFFGEEISLKKNPMEIGESDNFVVNPLHVLLRILPYGISVFLNFLVTLCISPAVTMQIVSSYDAESKWAKTFYVPVVVFLLHDVSDYVGRALAGLLKWPRPVKNGDYFTLLMSALRIIFVPLLLLCNIHPDSRSVTSVVFKSDVVFIVIHILFSVSNGYVGNICMMNAPQLVRPEEQQTAGSLMGALLGLGLVAGAVLCNYLVLLL